MLPSLVYQFWFIASYFHLFLTLISNVTFVNLQILLSYACLYMSGLQMSLCLCPSLPCMKCYICLFKWHWLHSDTLLGSHVYFNTKKKQTNKKKATETITQYNHTNTQMYWHGTHVARAIQPFFLFLPCLFFLTHTCSHRAWLGKSVCVKA